MKVAFINADDTSRHTSSANTAIYPNLGLLTLMSALSREPSDGEIIVLDYLDGTVLGNSAIQEFIEQQGKFIDIAAFSSLTANHGASIRFASILKSVNPSAIIIFGNDHFSAMYKNVMRNQSVVDFGFYGSDVVEGFAGFVRDVTSGTLKPFNKYPGLVYRSPDRDIIKVQENAREYSRLAMVDYSLADRTFPHNASYLSGQQRTYHFMRGRNLRSQVVDIGRGCIKFAGPRDFDVPENACDFCGIIPGGKAIASPSAERAWGILKNAFDQGYNYFYVTADELPLTLWPLLRDMAANRPGWYEELPIASRPKMFGYARAEGFDTQPDKIDVLIDQLGFDHFFIGFDGLSEISLRVMNKQPTGKRSHDLMQHNMSALKKMVDKGCLITAGFVVTHLGITPDIMEENFRKLEAIVSEHPETFAALDFGPLCPIPGSQSFHYLTNPDYAKSKADRFGLRINYEYLMDHKTRFDEGDLFEMDDLVEHFVRGCCPDISTDDVTNYTNRIGDVARMHGIVIGGGV